MSAPPDDVDTVHELLAIVWADAPSISDMDRISFETALIEVASNVIRHADSGTGVTCTLTIETFDDHIEATLSDTGEPGNVQLVGRAMPDELSESGRGIALVQALVHELDYDRTGGLNHWRLLRRFEK
jgi:serine/threonine-protein kinase RsbW